MSRANNMRVTDSGLIVPSYIDEETYGGPDGYRTILRPNSSAAFGAIAGGASLGLGKLLVTLPSLECVIFGSAINLAVKQTQGNITANTPKIGLGTTVASGAVSVLNGTAAFHNVMPEQTAADCNGTVTTEITATTLALTTGGLNKTIYANIAAAWSASGDAAAKLQGVAEIWWAKASF